MPTTVDLGFFHRDGAATAGRIGNLRARWDRHRGGALSLDCTKFSGGPLAVAGRVRLRDGDAEILLRQEDDPDPRLIVCEQGPERIWMRVMWSLIDTKGNYRGDGLTETILYADGEVRLAFGLRLVGAGAACVADAWIETALSGPLTGGTVGTSRPAPLPLEAAKSWTFKRQLKGRYVAADAKRGGVALGFYSLDGRPIDKLGTGKGIYWSAQGDRAPWYDTWGHLYGQWNGHSGWGAFNNNGGRLVSEPGEKELSLQWKWLHEADEPAGEVFGLRAMLGVFFAASAEAAVERVKLSHDPVVPRLRECELRCLDAVENTLLLRALEVEGLAAEIVFPRDPLARTMRVRLIGLAAGSVSADINDEPVVLQRHNLGGMTDDPYGPNLARPGDRFTPLIGDESATVSEIVVSVQLSADGPTTLKVRDDTSTGLVYMKWDDRELYELRDGLMAEDWPVAQFSPRTLCLHDLRAGDKESWHPTGIRQRTDRPSPALVRVPLYWYPTNVATQGQCTNRPERLTVTEDDGGLVLRVTSHDPAGRARSKVDANFCSCEILAVDVRCRLTILRPWLLTEMQFLNAFPYNSRRTADWETDWVYTQDADGHETTYFIKEPRGRSVVGDQKKHWKRAFFFAQGSRDRGNIFLLAKMPRGSRQVGRYVLCRVWLDSHFSIDQAKLKKGVRLAVDYTLAVAGDKRLSRADAAEIARRSLKAGELLLEG